MHVPVPKILKKQIEKRLISSFESLPKMTKISTRRPDGTLFGQNSAPVGFSVDLSEPLVCVFRGASRPCACFARDENVEIF